MRVRRSFVALLALLTLGASAVSSCSSPADPDENAVKALALEFLQHLEAGEAEAALALTDVSTEDVSDNNLLTDRVYGKVANRPTEIEVGRVSDVPRSTDLRVSVSYLLGNEKVTDYIPVMEDGPDSFVIGFADSLGIRRHPPQPTPEVLRMYSVGEMVIESSTRVTRDGGDGVLTGNALAFAGDYAVSYHDPVEVTEAPDQTVRVTGISLGAEVELVPTFTDEVVAWYPTAFRALVDECIAAGAVGTDCLGYKESAARRQVAEDIVVSTYPVPGLAESDGRWMVSTLVEGGSPGVFSATDVESGQAVTDARWDTVAVVERDMDGGLVLSRVP